MDALEEELFGSHEEQFSSEPDYSSGGSLNLSAMRDPLRAYHSPEEENIKAQLHKHDSMISLIATRIQRMEIALAEVLNRSSRGIKL